MEDCFNDLITGQGEGAGWRQNREPAENAMNSVAAHAYAKRIEATFRIKKATFWGGNLSILSSLVGTPYLPTIKGGVLFLEDVAEHPYRVERMLTQLLYSGVLARQKAIVLGQFTEYKLVPHDKGFKLQTVVDWLRSQISIPVLTNLPYGHVAQSDATRRGAVELAVGETPFILGLVRRNVIQNTLERVSDCAVTGRFGRKAFDFLPGHALTLHGRQCSHDVGRYNRSERLGIADLALRRGKSLTTGVPMASRISSVRSRMDAPSSR